MVSAIGSATFYPAAGVGRPAAGGLEAQLARFEKQLSEWTCCDSAKTPGGKQKIQEISDRIGEIKARIDAVAAASADERAAVSRPAQPELAAAPIGVSASSGRASAVGNLVDVIA